MTSRLHLLFVALAGCGSLPGFDASLFAPDTTAARQTPWTCQEPGPCPWDCTGDGLRIDTPGVYILDLTADCTLDLAAWGGGGGGAAADAGGGGGGGTSVITDDGTWPGREWVIAGGGGGGGAGDDDGDGLEGGGGGGGAFATTTANFTAGQRLWLRVGGGAEPGCAMRRGGDGGAPDGGYTGDGPYETSEYGGGRGGGAGYGSGDSLHGGGGGGIVLGRSVWGGGGGQGAPDPVCGTTSKHGNIGGCKGPLREGGGGGGGGGLGTTVVRGESGTGGHEGGLAGRAGWPAPTGPRVDVVPGPGRGGIGGVFGCSSTAGADGLLTLTPATLGTGLSCPPDEVDSCDGGCEPAKHLGDGICDAALDCDTHARDGGDCPEDDLVLPTWMVDTCPHVTSQSGFCLSVHREYGPDPDHQALRPSLIGLDDGAFCPLFEYDYSYATKIELVQVFQQATWVRPYRNLVAMATTETGTKYMRQLDLGDQFYADVGWMEPFDYDYDFDRYQYLTAYEDGFLIHLFHREWRHYPRFDDLALGNYTVSPVPADGPAGYIVSIDGGRLYRTQSRGPSNEVLVHDLATGAELPTIILQGDHESGSHDHSGFEVHNGRIWLTAFDGPGALEFKPFIAGFNLETGALEVVYPMWEGNNTDAEMHGLFCYKG